MRSPAWSKDTKKTLFERSTARQIDEGNCKI